MPEALLSPCAPPPEDVFCWEFPLKLGLLSDYLPSPCISQARFSSHLCLFLDLSGFSS